MPFKGEVQYLSHTFTLRKNMNTNTLRVSYYIYKYNKSFKLTIFLTIKLSFVFLNFNTVSCGLLGLENLVLTSKVSVLEKIKFVKTNNIIERVYGLHIDCKISKIR